MPWSFLAPKRPQWFRWTSIAAGACLLIFLVWTWWIPWAPGRFGGLVAGTLATIIFVIDGLYPLRRRLLAWPLRTAQQWLQFHLYGGIIGSLLVLLHMGFRWPSGWFGWTLLLLTTWTTAAGLVGVWLQKWIPTLIVNNLTLEALYDRIPDLVGRLQAQADAVTAGASEILDRAYQADIRPALATVSPSWSYLFDITGTRERRMQPLRNISQFLTEEERTRLGDLQAIVGEKTELDAQLSLQRALRLWLVLHVPPALLLLAVVAVHILAVVYL